MNEIKSEKIVSTPKQEQMDGATRASVAARLQREFEETLANPANDRIKEDLAVARISDDDAAADAAFKAATLGLMQRGVLTSSRLRDLTETDPNHYSLIFDIGLGEMRAAISEGKNPWALMVDMPSGKMYIGDHHKVTQERHKIPTESLYEGFVQISENLQSVELLRLSEWRERKNPKVIESGPFKSAIEVALKRDFLAKQGV